MCKHFDWPNLQTTTVRAPGFLYVRKRACLELQNGAESHSCLSYHSSLECSCSMFACNQSWNQTYTVSELPVSAPSRPTGHSYPTRRPPVTPVCQGFNALSESAGKGSSNIWFPPKVRHWGKSSQPCKSAVILLGPEHQGCKGWNGPCTYWFVKISFILLTFCIFEALSILENSRKFAFSKSRWKGLVSGLHSHRQDKLLWLS